MQKSNFDQLLDRYLTGKVSDQEQARLEAWMEIRKTNNETEVDLSADEQEKLFQKITGKIEPGDEFVVRGKARRFSFTTLLGVAATLAIILFSVALLRTLSSPDVNKRILNDGTLVWLKGESSIIYVESANRNSRQANLTGSALFEVTKDPSRPFILTCGDYKIKVLGTSFNVTPHNNGLEIEVLTGRVNLSSTRDSVGIIVESNQKVVYSGNSDAQASQLTTDEIQTAVSSTEYDMRFEHIQLKTVFERIEKKFDVTVAVSNSDILNCEIRADFSDHSLESTMLLISEVVPIKYKIDAATVSVTGEGCKQ